MPLTDNERLRDFSLVRQMQVLRAAESETNALLGLYREADEELTSMLLRVRDPASITASRLRALQEQIREALERQHAAVAAGVRTAMAETGLVEAEAAAGALNRVFVPVGLDTVTPRAAAILAAIRSTPFEGMLQRDWLKRLHQGDLARVQQAVLRGITLGQTTDEMVRGVVGTQSLRFTDGSRQVSRRGLRTLVRTGMIHASTVGRSQSWEANADLIEGELFVATLDSRTSPTCQDLDGDVYPVGEGPQPPVHMSCRSARTPILKGERELGLPVGTRASLDGQVPANLTYEEWLRGRSAEFQDRVLGPTKGALFRNGMPVSKFVSATGRPLTIAQLRSAAPAAFREAGLISPTGPLAAATITTGQARGLAALAKIKDLDADEKWFDFDAGPEIGTRSIWPINERRKSGFHILGIQRDTKGFRNRVALDPTELAPSQPGMVRSAIQRYVALEDPTTATGLGDGGVRVGFLNGIAHIQAGHHRLAAAALRGNATATADAYYYIQNGARVKQVSFKKYLEQNPSPTLAKD